MRAVRIHEEGGPEVVRVDRDVPVPEPGRGEALVRMRASALNRIDIWIRLGKPSRPKPHTLGADGAGVVESLGPGTEGPEKGTEVVINPGLFCGLCEACLRGQQSLCESFAVLGEHVPGTHADYCVVPVRNLHPKPEALSFAEAAAYPLVFATAWRMLMRARLQPGEWVLVWGAGSGVGSAAVTLASALGARVIATASRDDVLAAARERGAMATINHRSDDVLAAVRDLTGGRGADVVYEHVGADTWATSIEALRRGGRLVLTGATTGGNPPARLHRIFWKQLDVLGSTMASDSEFRAVTRLFAQGRIRPLVDSVRPLEDVREAQRRLEAGEQNGKLVLEIADAEAGEVVLVPDGAVSGNPGPGGWAVVLVKGEHRRELSGAEPHTTNNRMELRAVIEGLKALTRPCRVRVQCDSTYVVNAHRQGWLRTWQRNGWRTASRKPVENQDLWQELLAAEAPHEIAWELVKGHAGHELNERADELAVQARERAAGAGAP